MKIKEPMNNVNPKNLMTRQRIRSANLKSIAKSLGRDEVYPLDLAIAMVENLGADCETILYVLNHVERGGENNAKTDKK